MLSLDGFLQLVADDLHLELDGAAAARVRLDDLPGWDSVHLLRLVALLEEETGGQVSVRTVMEARSLADVYAVVEEKT